MKTDNKRNITIDVAKGIGIILVVWVHAGGPFSSYIGQFHMPLFFLISGYLYNSRRDLKEYLIHKIQHLWIPFMFWNILSLTAKFVLSSFSSTPQYIMNVFLVLFTVSHDGTFFGATWFLGALLVVSCLYGIMDYYSRECSYNKLVIAFLFGMAFMIGININLPYYFSRTLVLSFFYAIGTLVKQYGSEIFKIRSKAIAIFSLVLFCIAGSYNVASMGQNEYRYQGLFLLGTLIATYVVLYFSRLLSQTKRLLYAGNMLAFLGINSMDIMIWHFVAFRIVIIIQLIFDGLPLSGVMEFYPTYDSSGIWWIFYLFVGVVGSLILGGDYDLAFGGAF